MCAAVGAPHRDVPGTALCRNDHPALRRASHNADAGHSTGRAPHSGCSGSDRGRRRVISVVADLPVSLRTTTLMARRWDAKGGPEGRSFRVACSPRSGPSFFCRGATRGFRCTTGCGSSRRTGRRWGVSPATSCGRRSASSGLSGAGMATCSICRGGATTAARGNPARSARGKPRERD